jgi:phosphomannomutase
MSDHGKNAETVKHLQFRGRTPVPLAFGTSGLRGLVTDITDLEAYINTRGFLDFTLAAGDAQPGTPIAVGGDLRPSTDSPERSIMRAVVRAIADAGFEPVCCGKVPTPALTYVAMQQGWPSIMVTGSHIPFDRNGIKFNKSGGEVLKSDEAPILEAVSRVRRAEYARPSEESQFGDDGMLRPEATRLAPCRTLDIQDAYLERYRNFFPSRALAGLRVLVYEHSAVGRELLTAILSDLGAEVHAMGRTEEFIAIDTEAIAEERLLALQRLSDEARARLGKLDAIVSTDGDSDRPMILGVEPDGRVRFLSGDIVGIVTADYLAADAISVSVSATDAIDEFFVPKGVSIKRTRIGSPMVIAGMAELEGSRVVGWEPNGGFLTGSSIVLDGRELLPLPTRDAMLPILAVLHAACRRGLSLSELFAGLPQRFTKAGLIDGVPVPVSRAITARYTPADPSIVKVAYDAGRVRVVRASGQPEEASAELGEELRALRSGLSRHFSASRGFGEIAAIDFLDGIRMTFDGGDIGHVRASGTAPQLRLYAIASTEARAAAMVDMAITDGGLLWALVGEAQDAASP